MSTHPRTSRARRGVVTSLAGIALAGSAAADGRIEINHAAALAGVMVGDLPGYPVTLSQSGSYVLTGNLAPTGTQDAIVINAGVSHVELDLAGFAIVGPVGCTRAGNDTTCSGAAGNGIAAQLLSADIAVRDGSIRGMAFGIALVLARNARIERVQTASNGSGGILVGEGARVESSIADLNGGDGIAVGSDSTVERSIATRNRAAGIAIYSGCRLLHNVVNENLVGVDDRVDYGGSSLIGNVAMRNSGAGFELSGTTGWAKNVLTANNRNTFETTNLYPHFLGGRATGLNLCGGGTGCDFFVPEGFAITFTDDDWGDDQPKPDNPAGLLEAYYNTVYLASFGILEIGIPGPAGYSIRFIDASNVRTYLPTVGPGAPLPNDVINPEPGIGGQFGSGAVALRLNIDFADAGLLVGDSGVRVGNLRMCNLTQTLLNGLAVRDFLFHVSSVLGGGPQLYSIAELTVILAELNLSYFNGTTSAWAQAHLAESGCP